MAQLFTAENITLALAALSALFAAIATVANLVQARRSAQANEVSIYLDMLKDYGSTEMRSAISELAKFWRDRKTMYSSVEEAYKAELEINPQYAGTLRGHCRLLSSYFVNAARLYEAGLIPKKFTRTLIAHPGLNVFYDVAVPINLSKNSQHNSGKYVTTLRGILSQHGDGIF